MASPGVIDGAATPEDMYSPSKNAHCCGLSTECIVCMHARAHSHTYPRKRTGLLHVHTENTIHESTQQQIFKKEAVLGWWILICRAHTAHRRAVMVKNVEERVIGDDLAVSRPAC